jgi:hypothetical protein
MKISLVIILMLGMISGMKAQNPHILVNSADKEDILKKIDQQGWAKTIFSEMDKEVSPYVNRHQNDPQWILSRYLMNRIPGKRYTKVYADRNGLKLIKWEGDAPVPTVRINTYVRGPVTEKGTSYRQPALEEVVPYDTSRVMNLFNPETGKKEWIDPQGFVTSINGDINELALDAAIVYWLKGEEKYAKFAADLLDQWAKGAFYQEPIIGPGRCGFMDLQTLGDQSWRPLMLAYDFIKPYMKQKGYDLHWYEPVFEKFASTEAFRGFWDNNWYAAESSTLVYAALSLENQQKKDYYLQFVLEKDTINGSWGQLALPSTVEKWLTPDGHWKEPGGYHNYPVSSLLVSALALEKNGYDIFRRFPALFKASYAMIKYSYPDLAEGGFGDTGRASQDAGSLEIGITGAVKYKDPILPDMLAGLKRLMDGGIYKRERSGYMGLLCYLPEIPETKADFRWPRSGTLDFAKYFIQRNGTDPETGLMYGVQGATYNHNHCNGMSMELYGCGIEMGIDAGTGATYEHPLHQNYYAQWGAHNTVVAAGISASVPFSGSAGAKQIGQIELAAMEPMPDQGAVSPEYSFTDTRYLDKSTGTNESRTLAVIRTSERTGYYVDIYRSDNSVSNDYIYHNIGDRVDFLTEKREPLKTINASYPLTGKDYPGFRFYTDVRKLENQSGNIIARFSAKNEKSEAIFMQALIEGNEGRTFYTAFSPHTKTSGRVYRDKDLPLFTIRTEAEAKTRPFIVVYEPFKGENRNSVERISVDKRNDGSAFTSLTVFGKGGLKQHIYQSVDETKKFTVAGSAFCGYFGVAGYAGAKLTSLYLGKGTEITEGGYSLKSAAQDGSANLKADQSNWLISCNQETEVGLPMPKVKKAILKSGKDQTNLKITKTGAGVKVNVPSVQNGVLVLE